MATTKPASSALVTSLVACLRFAVPLVQRDANPQSICSKTTLGAMVVDAHRVAQQATAHHIAHKDPRRLLYKILPLDDQLSRLSFNDITWDAEGDVTQSLEMELQDLEERASASRLCNFCVLLTASEYGGSNNTADSALLWFPRMDDECNNNSTNKKYLLYVVPGRIKIVKSLAELVRKMQEEIPTLRRSSATYRVWTMVEATIVAKKTLAPVPSPAMKIETARASMSSSVMPRPKQEQTPENDLVQNNISKESIAFDVTRELRPLRVRVQETGLVEQPTIFNFPQAEQVILRGVGFDGPKGTSSEPSDETEARSDGGVDLGQPGHVFSYANAASQGQHDKVTAVECRSPVVPQIPEKLSHARMGISASHVQALPKQSNTESVDATTGWRSFDGERRRHMLGPIRQEYSPSPPANLPVSDPVATNEVGKPIRPLTERDRGVNSMFHFSSSHALEHPPSNYSGSSKVDQLSHAGQTDNDEISLIEHPASNSNELEVVLNSEQPFPDAVETESTKYKKKKRSARDHYRNKLGARGWWELEYQATKILQQHHGQHQLELEHSMTAVVRSDDRCLRDAASEKPFDRCAIHPASMSAHSSDADEKKQTPRAFSPTQLVVRSVHINEIPPAKSEIVFRRSSISSDDLTSTNHASTLLLSCDEDVHQSVATEKLSPMRSRNGGTIHHHKPGGSKPQPPDPIAPSGTNDVSTQEEPLRWVTSVVKVSQMSRCDIPSQNFIRTEPATSNIDRSSLIPSRGVSATQKSTSLRQPEALRPPPIDSVVGVRTEKEKGHVMSSHFRRMATTTFEDEDEHDSVLLATMASHNRPAKNLNREIRSHIDEWEPTRQPVVADEGPVRPFHAHGRVPIRHRQETKPRQRRSRAESNEDDNDIVVEPIDTTEETPVIVVDDTPPSVASAKPRGPPIVAKFTAGSPVKSHDEATQLARQQKLTELRQKKIQQLQKARDDAMDKKKQSHTTHPQQPQHPRSVSILVPVSSAPTPPTTAATAAAQPTIAVEKGDSFALVSTTTTNGYVRVRKPSNRKLVQNAIEYTLLAGGSLDKERHAALQSLSDSPCDNFIVLLKSAKELKFRALYEHHVERHHVVRIFSVAASSPPLLSSDVISQFFRYNSGKKEFTAIDGREFTVKTDACALVDQLVFKKKPLHRLL